ncbi:hypothetical protein HNV11_18725 [Spirosoma taeanense]|uniref:Uncharacterized protein n=1 Tax=Spirosoma taeanense TaxID=2735870 RepID=A0A6M5YCG7_9BACT|nr:hypothetical protein [Spirosoma taeanense]QJW91264.1 hypothetical protein HNV11_18725 [Spirosoma taeanense]
MEILNANTTTPARSAFWNQVPRPVLFFATLILLLAILQALIGGLTSRPDKVALAIGDGLMSVFHDDKSLKNMVLIFTKNGKNNDGTAELRDFGAGLGGLFTGQMRAGGELYFHNYRHRSGVVLNGGPLDVELSNTDDGQQKAGRLRIQGQVAVTGSDQPVYVQLDFISPKETYEVQQLSGTITLNGAQTTLKP